MRLVQDKAGSRAPRVGLFVTCLVDLMRPSIGFAALKLLEQAGCKVEVPSQTCCGQPGYNSGDRATARDLAEQVIRSFSHCDYVVAPSGSCAGMIKAHYPELFADDPNLAPKAQALAAKTPMLITQILPGQEEGNARLLVQNGCGTHCPTNESVVSVTSQLFSQDAVGWHRMHRHAAALSRPDAALTTARWVEDQCKGGAPDSKAGYGLRPGPASR